VRKGTVTPLSTKRDGSPQSRTTEETYQIDRAATQGESRDPCKEAPTRNAAIGERSRENARTEMMAI